MPVYSPEAAELHRKQHATYIASGGCSSVYWTKAWCNAKSGTSHQHYAFGINVNTERWADRDAVTCPCVDKS